MISAEDELLIKLYRRLKSQRSKYIHFEAFKSFPNYMPTFEELRKKGLVFFYKARKVVGLTKDGYLYVLYLLEEHPEEFC